MRWTFSPPSFSASSYELTSLASGPDMRGRSIPVYENLGYFITDIRS